MPTYEYECTRCGKITEEVRSITAPRRQRCPACRGKVVPVISGGLGVVFKGEGFYVNDSRRDRRGAGSTRRQAELNEAAGSGAEPTGAGGPGPDGTGPDRTGPVKAGPDKAGPDKAASGGTSAGKGAAAGRATASDTATG